MRILLAQNSLYYPAHGGGDKSNRLLVEALAARGHECRVVARLPAFGPGEHEQYLRELAARDVRKVSCAAGAALFRHQGVEVHVLTADPHLRAYFSRQIAEFDPSVIVSSTDDPAQVLLEAAVRAEGPRVVYLARATLALPFGPDCAFPSETRTELLRQAEGLVGVSGYVAGYIRRWSGIEAVALPISLLEPGPWPELGRFDNEFVTLVNPCAVKGISIFLALAARMPGVRFAAVPTWGTNETDRAALRALSNVEILDPVDDIDKLLARTRALLVPSLWAEARSRIVVEAMLRGVPVLASDVGGIPEAKMGVDYLLPVRPIAKYQTRLDEQMVPVADVPEQDIGPWHAALQDLLSDRRLYERLSRQSRQAAMGYASNLGVGPFESFLEDVLRSPRRTRTAAKVEAAPAGKPLDQLSPEKRRLLALRLRRSAAAGTPVTWFPGLNPQEQPALRLFCLPHAGGGTTVFRDWAAALPASVALCPVRPPGRESRIGEPAFDRMGPLLEALGEVMLPHTARPYGLFGHSMGAAIAFELARWMRRRHAPAPAALFVSGARAPQFRLNHVPPPEPGEDEFLDELRRLEGVPPEVLENAELMRVLLPGLRADAALYRNYVYTEEPPLDCPIRAYGGSEDRNVARGQLERWGEQTTASFGWQVFPGGHFYLQTSRKGFLEALARDLRQTTGL
jgi:surfactin synthase thioesterase subunit/glycosyltransferase involved in cell wall biosynthesis